MRQLISALLALATIASANAMTFDIVMLNGEPAIRARGEIVPGDAARLKAVLNPRAKHSYGYFTVILDSPGGSVASAFELSSVIDAHYVNTYVEPGGKCISACAAIVFVSGREHINVPGGLLGFHGCYHSGTKKIEPMCNDDISRHAFAHGTSYGAVMAFIEKIPHDQVVWINGQQADCLAINRYDISPKPANYMRCVIDMVKDMKR